MLVLLAQFAAAYSAKHFNNGNIIVTNVILLLFGGIHSYIKCDSGTCKKKNAWIDTVTCNNNVWSTPRMETLVHMLNFRDVKMFLNHFRFVDY